MIPEHPPRKFGEWLSFPYAYPILLFVAWTLAWVLNRAARGIFELGDAADTIYWAAAKLAIWVAPTIWFMRREYRGDCHREGPRASIADFFDLREPAKGLRFGLLVGLGVIAVSSLLDFALGAASFGVPVLDLSFVNAALVAPFAEEWAIRGFYLRGVTEARLTKWPMLPQNANTAAAIVFVAMHLPGWYFQGRLREPFGVVQQAIFLWLFGLVLGWTKQQSKSLYASMIVHVMNNLYVASRG